MTIYALKAPAQSFTMPAWVTVHNAEIAGAALVIILLAFAVLRLSKGRTPAPVPAPAAKKSGGGGKLLLLVAAAAGGWWLLKGHATAIAGAKAAPAPSPSPTPTPTVTRTVAPPATAPHFSLPLHLTGGNWVALAAIAAVVTIVIFLNARRGD